MSLNESAINTAPSDVTSTATTSGSNPADSSPAPNVAADTSSADVNTQQSVQDTQPSQTEDVLAGFPPDAELQEAVANKTPFAEMAARIKGAYEPLKQQFSELQDRHKVFENFQEKFSAPEEVQQLVDMRESLMGWERDDKGQLQPSTQKFIEHLDPQRAEFLFADLADGNTTDPRTGQQVPRMDRALQFIATDPERRANALKILGGVEPSAVAPQWQATDEQLAVVSDDLKDTFKRLPYDTREKLALNDPDFINDYLKKEKFQNDLMARDEQRNQQDAQAQQQREQMVQQEAQAAGNAYVRTQLDTALTIFHNSVVEQCKLIEPLDPQNPPEGMDATQVAAMNQQIDSSNKAEAAQITLAVIGLINEETRPFVLPLLKEIGIVDDKFLAQLDAAGKGFGDNARNYGHLTYTQKLGKNGNYAPGADVTMLNTESGRNLKLLAYYANQVSKKLIEAKSQTFSMKATGHNQILNGAARSRPSANGGAYDPTTAATQRPQGWMTRDEIQQQFG